MRSRVRSGRLHAGSLWRMRRSLVTPESLNRRSSNGWRDSTSTTGSFASSGAELSGFFGRVAQGGDLDPPSGRRLRRCRDDSKTISTLLFEPGPEDTTMTISDELITDGSEVAKKVSAARTVLRIVGASGSSNGMLPALTSSTADWFISNEAVVSPARANARARGRPTWPHPPTITIFGRLSLCTIERLQGCSPEVRAPRRDLIEARIMSLMPSAGNLRGSDHRRRGEW